MTVADLIARLQELPGDLPVLYVSCTYPYLEYDYPDPVLTRMVNRDGDWDAISRCRPDDEKNATDVVYL